MERAPRWRAARGPFKQGILDVVTTTIHTDDHTQLSPVSRPNVRLHGMGIMNATAGVRMEPELTDVGREGLELAI